MLKELYTAAMGMLPQQTRLEVLANNIANASTSGYKRESVFERNLIDARANFYNVQGDAEQEDPPIGSYSDFDAGAFQKTDNPLDLAIETQNGFFLVQDENQNQFLTRAGHFQLDQDGYIVTTDGKKLVGANGELNIYSNLAIDSNDLTAKNAIQLNINENGEVWANEQYIDTILVADVDNLDSLERISDACFVATDTTEMTYAGADDIVIQQGWLENSNVDIIKEMVAMIELQRMFEVGSKVIQTNNDTLDSSLRLGRYT